MLKKLLLIVSASLISVHSFAATLALHGQVVIDKPTTYTKTTIDMSQGFFFITNGATLTLSHSILKGNISPTHNNWITVDSGNLVMAKNKVEVTAVSIIPDPYKVSLNQVIHVSQGKVYLYGNDFSVDKLLSVNLLYTENKPTNGFTLTDNRIKNFHGAFFLINSNYAYIARNRFKHVSLSNIFTKDCHDNLYENNTMLYSGNNGIDLINSDGIIFRNNYISLSTCYSILIMRSKNLTIDHNAVIGGITYALIVIPSLGQDPYLRHLRALISDLPQEKTYTSQNISVTNNYFSQNRYGMTTLNLDGLIAKNNLFIQRFSNDDYRRFWTNNDVLLRDTLHLDWQNNFYKEAYDQMAQANNAKSNTVLPFPVSGGVTITLNQ